MWDEEGNGGFKNHIEIRYGFVKSNHFKWTYLDFVCFEQEVNNLWDYALEIKCWSCRFIFHSVMWCLDVWYDSHSIPVYLFSMSLFTSRQFALLHDVGKYAGSHELFIIVFVGGSSTLTSPVWWLDWYAMHLSQATARALCVLTDEWLQTIKPVQVWVRVV